MQSTKEIKPQFEIILANESQYSFVEIRNAKKDKEIEIQQAHKMNLSIEQFRLQKMLNLQQYAAKMDAAELFKQEMDNISLKDFGKMVIQELNQSCENKGAKFVFHDEPTKIKYKEVIRYMFGSDTEFIDKNKFLYLFGRYGNGKSLLLKSIYKILLKIQGADCNWQYFHIPTFINKSLSAQSIKVFDEIFNCKKNMILDEFGDQVEKSKIYNEEKSPMRQLVLDKYDKWISNNGNGQKIAITSNLFPDESFFYHQKLAVTTLHEFYDEKLMNKMKENYNLIRFPNISFRDNNVTKML